MRQILDNLRQKNEPQKMMISIILAAVVTFVLVASWLAWNSANKKAEVVEEKPVPEEITPASSLKDQFDEIKSMFGELKTQFDGAQEILNAIPEIDTATTSTTSVNSTTTSEIESSNE